MIVCFSLGFGGSWGFGGVVHGVVLTKSCRAVGAVSEDVFVEQGQIQGGEVAWRALGSSAEGLSLRKSCWNDEQGLTERYQESASIDNDVRAKYNQYNTVKTNLAALQRKQT